MLNQNGSSVSPKKKKKKEVNFPSASKTSRAIFKGIRAKHTYFTMVFYYLYTCTIHAFLFKLKKTNVMKG